ncbi:MAG: ribosome silencing factor [Bacteroidales bacterium]|nr:MAG: ribosome silencing factor [Bacteroidales bacterium]
MLKSYTFDNESLVREIVQGIQKKNGNEIVKVDLAELENSFCRLFIICHGNSSTQVSSIAESVEETVKNELEEKVWHREGLENAQWVLLDYGDIVVHIFQKEYRDFYNLEELWADAKFDYIEEIDLGVKQK